MKHDTTFLYKKDYKSLRFDIEQGNYKNGDRLPSLDQLSKTFQVNRLTARRAIDELKEQGLVYALPAKGTFVGKAPHTAAAQILPQESTIGIFFTVIQGNDLGYYYMELLDAIRTELASQQLNVKLLTQLDLKQSHSHEIKGLNAILIVGPCDDLLEDYCCPAIHIVPQSQSSRLPAIEIDNCQGGFMAGRHLINLGHRNLAVIQGDTDQPCTAERLRGFKLAIQDYDDAKLQVFDGLYNVESGIAASEQIMKDAADVTAIFAMNDEMAAGAIQGFTRQGISVPEKISVIGFDNSKITTMLSPPLTTIGISTSEIAKIAVHHLHRPSDLRYKTLVYPNLVIRDSCKKLTD